MISFTSSEIDQGNFQISPPDPIMGNSVIGSDIIRDHTIAGFVRLGHGVAGAASMFEGTTEEEVVASLRRVAPELLQDIPIVALNVPEPKDRISKGIEKIAKTLRGEEAYQYRSQGMQWADIAVRLDFSTANAASMAAAYYAKKTLRKWPLDESPRPERGYKARKKGATWDEVAIEVGYKNHRSAHASVYSWAQKKGLEWPPEGRKRA